MNSFHRTKRESRVVAFIGLTFCLFLSLLFIFIGFHSLFTEDTASMELIFGIAGLVVFIIFIRGAWMISGCSLTHVFSIDKTKVTWGYAGKEKELPINSVKNIYWDDSDGFTLLMTTNKNEQIRFLYIENTISLKSRPALLEFLRNTLPHIPIHGDTHRTTKQLNTHEQ